MTQQVFIIDAKRTPVGKYGGSLAGTSATNLGTIVIKSLLKENPQISGYIDEVILGNVISAGLGQNPARIAAYNSGIVQTVPSLTINKVCGSGLKSVALAVSSIQNEDAQVIIAGGMENMSMAPYLLDNYRFGTRLGNHTIRDSMIYDGLFCSLIGEPMGITAENIAKKYKISRKDQDAYAFRSHQKALRAIKNKKFHQEIIPVKINTRKESIFFETDEQPRPDTSIDALKKLSPVFKKNGTVTAGNSSSLNDAAGAVIIASEKFVKKRNIKPMAKAISFSSVGINPAYMGLGAYYAAKKCLLKTKIKITDVDLWEINEAFASQTLAVINLLGIDEKKVNVNGGALALGHPIGASGTRILTTLLYELKRQKKQFGVASLCIGGGQGVAMVVENV